MATRGTFDVQIPNIQRKRVGGTIEKVGKRMRRVGGEIVTVRSQTTTVSVYGLGEDLERIINAALPDVLQEMERGVDDSIRATMEHWPVDSGDSLRGFSRETSIDVGKDRLIVRATNTEDYWRYVKITRFTRSEVEEVKRRLDDDLKWLRFKTLKEVRSRWPEHEDDKRIQDGLDKHQGRNFAPTDDSLVGKHALTTLRRSVMKLSKDILPRLQAALDRMV